LVKAQGHADFIAGPGQKINISLSCEQSHPPPKYDLLNNSG
jgi:hypothetical protein